MSDCLSFQEYLNKLVTWSTTWNLLFNEKKCSLVRFCSNDSPVSYNYHLNSKPVEVKTSHVDLGVMVTTDLQWKSHHLHMISKPYKPLGLLCRVFSSNHLTDYHQRLVSLNLLPFMMIFEINDIIFFIKCLKQPSKRFNILSFVYFCSSQTWSSAYFKLRHSLSRKNYTRHFYFNRLPRLWNSLPYIDIQQ